MKLESNLSTAEALVVGLVLGVSAHPSHQSYSIKLTKPIIRYIFQLLMTPTVKINHCVQTLCKCKQSNVSGLRSVSNVSGVSSEHADGLHITC